jgi:sodium/hydrogen exchanger 8
LGWSKEAFTENEHVIISEYLLIFMVLLASSTILQYFIGKVLKWHFIPEAAATLILGMVIGVMIRLCGGYDNVNEHVTSERFDANLLGFSPTVFFFGFLPPIIFNSGYHLKRKLFFSNFLGIFSLSIIGTCFSLLTFALGLYSLGLLGLIEDMKTFSFIELVAFGALISR